MTDILISYSADSANVEIDQSDNKKLPFLTLSDYKRHHYSLLITFENKDAVFDLVEKILDGYWELEEQEEEK